MSEGRATSRPSDVFSRQMQATDEASHVDDHLRHAYVVHRAALVRLCALLAGSDSEAEDLVHDVFLRSQGRLPRRSDRETYVYLRAAVINGWRNVRRHRSVEARAIPKLVGTRAGDHADAVVAQDQMWGAIRALPERQRAVIVLRFYEDLPDREIARLLSCTQATVRSQAKRALHKLQEVIEP
jgi:RNA polymerase sigma factor (sigma-70 family)